MPIKHHINDDGYNIEQARNHKCIVLPEYSIAVSNGKSLHPDHCVVLMVAKEAEPVMTVYFDEDAVTALSEAILNCTNAAMLYSMKGMIPSISHVIEDKFVRTRKVEVIPDAINEDPVIGKVRVKVSDLGRPGKAKHGRVILHLEPEQALELVYDLSQELLKLARKR